MATPANKLRSDAEPPRIMLTEKPGDAPPPADEKQPTVEELQRQLADKDRELAAEKKLRDEITKRDEFWSKRQPKGEAPPVRTGPAPAPAPEEPDPLESLNLLDLITNEQDPAIISKKLAKAMRDHIRRGGYVTKAELDATVANLIAQATQIGSLVQEYPDLSNTTSELFKETQTQLAAMSDNPVYAGTPEPVLQRLAAAQAKAKLLEEGKLKGKGAESAEGEGESEEDRQARVAAAGGLPTRSAPKGDTFKLTEWEKQFAAAQGIPESAILEQKKKINVGPVLAGIAGREQR